MQYIFQEKINKEYLNQICSNLELMKKNGFATSMVEEMVNKNKNLGNKINYYEIDEKRRGFYKRNEVR